MELIDTHQHLIWQGRFRYAWTDGIEPLDGRDFTPRDYEAAGGPTGAAGTIFMEAGAADHDYRDETRFVAKLVGRQGMLGQVASCRPEVAAGFDAWLEECVALGVNGFRRILHVMPDALSRDETFRANLRKIGRCGLPFDLTLRADQLPLAADLARACPDQVLVLDHCGNPDIAGGGFESWSADMRRLAAHPGLFVKLSGLTPLCGPGRAGRDTLAPWVDHLLEVFGPGRLLWGSDWPVVNLAGGLADWNTLTRQLLAELSDSDRDRIGQINPRAVYRL